MVALVTLDDYCCEAASHAMNCIFQNYRLLSTAATSPKPARLSAGILRCAPSLPLDCFLII